MNSNSDWLSDDAKRARRRLVRQARKVHVYVAGYGLSVPTTKAAAYLLIDTGRFTVAGGDDNEHDTVYVEVMA